MLQPSSPRVERACILVGYIMYLELCKKSFLAVYCVPVGDSWNLYVEPSRQCFSGLHWPVFLFALATLACAVCLPYLMWYGRLP